jgi:MinD-like ATPase involved in chromosome partitioning or flagellar assembly
LSANSDDANTNRHHEEGTTTPGTELVVAPAGTTKQLTLLGGNNDRVPSNGWRARLYRAGLNVGPSDAEIITTERAGCIECRQELKGTPGVLCVGNFSLRGGDGKSTMSTNLAQMFLDMNPAERPVIIDVNTSMTTLDVINGLDKKDFSSGRYWTMESLYDFLDAHPNLDTLEFTDIDAKLAYRRDPQLPVIPLQVTPSIFNTEKPEERQNDFSGEKYLLILSVLKRFFTLIIHDFGTSTTDELTRVAFSQLHMLVVLTHNGYATTQMVGYTLEMLFQHFPELFLNTMTVFNMSSRPSPQALRAIAMEKAGKESLSKRIKEHLSAASKSGKGGNKEIQTPGQALGVINDILAIQRLVNQLSMEEISLVGFDAHLKPERKLEFAALSDSVKAQLWTTLHRMLSTRVKFEQGVLKLVTKGQSVRREQMRAHFEGKNVVYTIAKPPRRPVTTTRSREAPVS